MDARKIRAEIGMGKSVFDLPLRVTFYARVSTDQDEQLNSLENQVQYYTELIQSRKNWTFVPGYIDEGISGTSTRRRDDFNRMIRDAGEGLFDLIITKEISRFSRSTLDSIRYTQKLLDHNVGVFFQNDNINTLDADSEFRLVIMAGVAQDEVRKLSERLKFGFKQAIKNGHVLGNDKLYGYDKKECVLTVNEEEAEIVRIVFDLYGNHRLGMRAISRELEKLGYTSREGNLFNTLTIRHMLENPKYKGWYCGNKSQTLDYRTGKKTFLEESEWTMYPDPTIPAIVSEALWNRANALYKERRREVLACGSGATYHNRYPYSTKIICQEHGTTFHRQVVKCRAGCREVWQCKIYRQKGRKACSAPQIRGDELDWILAWIFAENMPDLRRVTDALMTVLTHVPNGGERENQIARREREIASINQKKDRLLELHIAGAITTEEFKTRNDDLTIRMKNQECRLATIRQEREKVHGQNLNMDAIRQELENQLSFAGEINKALVATILDKVVVKKGSTKEEIRLDIYLKWGKQYEVVYTRELKNIGVEVYFVEDNIWTMDADGELRLSLMATLAQEESRKVSERVRTGQKVSREKGTLYGSGNILGYERVGSTYVINPDQAETVRMILDMYLNEGIGTGKIANRLTEMGRLNASGINKCSHGVVSRVLNNQTYMGVMAYGKSYSNNYLEQKRISNHDKSSYICVEGDFPPIVTPEEWYRAQEIKAGRVKESFSAKKGKKTTHGVQENRDLWGSRLRCTCGCGFRKNVWHKYDDKANTYGYQCYNILNNGSANQRRKAGADDTGYCDQPMIADWKLELMGKKILELVFQDKRDLIDHTCDMIRKCLQTARPQGVTLSNIVGKMERIKFKKEMLLEMRTAGEITKQEFLTSVRSWIRNYRNCKRNTTPSPAVPPSRWISRSGARFRQLWKKFWT